MNRTSKYGVYWAVQAEEWKGGSLGRRGGSSHRSSLPQTTHTSWALMVSWGTLAGKGMPKLDSQGQPLLDSPDGHDEAREGETPQSLPRKARPLTGASGSLNDGSGSAAATQVKVPQAMQSEVTSPGSPSPAGQYNAHHSFESPRKARHLTGASGSSNGGSGLAPPPGQGEAQRSSPRKERRLKGGGGGGGGGGHGGGGGGGGGGGRGSSGGASSGSSARASQASSGSASSSSSARASQGSSGSAAQGKATQPSQSKAARGGNAAAARQGNSAPAGRGKAHLSYGSKQPFVCCT